MQERANDSRPEREPIWPDEQAGHGRGRGLGDDLGAGLFEYAILMLLIAVGCLISLTALAPIISGFYNQFTALL